MKSILSQLRLIEYILPRAHKLENLIYPIDIILAISFGKLRIHNKIRLVKIFDFMQDSQDISPPEKPSISLTYVVNLIMFCDLIPI